MPLIKASQLRKKYFNEEIFTDATFEQLKTLCEKSIIDAAEKGEDSVIVNIPRLYKKELLNGQKIMLAFKMQLKAYVN